jgi:glycogen synthase
MTFDRYICVSDYTRHMLHDVEKIPYAKMVTINNGIDYSIWQPSVFYDLKAKELRTSL